GDHLVLRDQQARRGCPRTPLARHSEPRRHHHHRLVHGRAGGHPHLRVPLPIRLDLKANVPASLPAPRPGSGPTWPPRSTLRTQLVVIENVRGLLYTATECSRYARPRRSACSLTVKNDAGSSSANERPA